MKKDIHPEYKKIKVTCSCGQSFEVGTTRKDDLPIETCNRCHSFYTGKQKVATKGRVEKYKARYEMPRPVTQQPPKKTEPKKSTKTAKPVKATAPKKIAKKPEKTVSEPKKSTAKAKTTKSTKEETK